MPASGLSEGSPGTVLTVVVVVDRGSGSSGGPEVSGWTAAGSGAGSGAVALGTLLLLTPTEVPEDEVATTVSREREMLQCVPLQQSSERQCLVAKQGHLLQR